MFAVVLKGLRVPHVAQPAAFCTVSVKFIYSVAMTLGWNQPANIKPMLQCFWSPSAKQRLSHMQSEKHWPGCFLSREDIRDSPQKKKEPKKGQLTHNQRIFPWPVVLFAHLDRLCKSKSTDKALKDGKNMYSAVSLRSKWCLVKWFYERKLLHDMI